MALEIGTDSFVSVADADAYWNEHSGGTNWASASNPDKEKALREASQYIDKSYSWKGQHDGDPDQLLSWPRLNVIDDQGRYRDAGKVPQEIKDATAHLAEEALAGNLLPTVGSGGQPKSLKAGSVEIEYNDHAPTQKDFPHVDLLVSGLTRGGKNQTVLLKK